MKGNMKDVILTGLRANNHLHIGHYFGAMLPIIDMSKQRADEYQVNMFIPDLHSFTTPVEYGKPLHDAILTNARIFVASGLPLDNDNIHLYRQSHIPAHSELTWILDCFTGVGEMGRMTQYKDKSSKIGNDQVSVGLFNYPILMASDILLYGAKYVPLGDDQSQHLEFTRDIAERMNSKFGELFVVPEPVSKQYEFFGKDQGLRIKDLLDPSKKMSKSDDTGAGVIFLGDTPEEAKKKIMRATTDSFSSINYDNKKQPGISNLIDILALLRNTQPQEVAKQYENMNKYGEFKEIVANEIAEFLKSFQQRLEAVDNVNVLAKLQASETALNIQANKTLLRVQRAIGLRA